MMTAGDIYLDGRRSNIWQTICYIESFRQKHRCLMRLWKVCNLQHRWGNTYTVETLRSNNRGYDGLSYHILFLCSELLYVIYNIFYLLKGGNILYKIVDKKELAPNIYLMKVEANRVAASARPGQFVIVRVNETGERIPLTICDYDENEGTVTIVIQAVGSSTIKMTELNKGDYFADFAGPLGMPSELTSMDINELKEKKIIFIAGGVGTAPVYPQVKWLRKNSIPVDVIVGGKSENYLILTDELKQLGANIYLCTDDGSKGFKGLVTGLLKVLIEKNNGYDIAIAIGPMIMMKFVSKLTKEYDIKTIVSLNTLMVDGTGMCGACRVTIGGNTKFACVDGPEFDGHQVDFDEAMRRQALYKTEEGKALLEMKEKEEGHICHIGLGRVSNE